MTHASRMNHSPAHTPKLGATIHNLPSFRNGTVSIHAPAWGATYVGTGIGARRVFQSTLPRGERHRRHTIVDIVVRFNPRSHVGSDNLLSGNNHLFDVSIHAPTWGATQCPLRHKRPNRSFNPRSRVGSDVYVRDAYNRSTKFQSTLPRGERRKHQ